MAVETKQHQVVSVSVVIWLRAQYFEQTHTHTQLLNADASRQMNQIQEANTDTTLYPILTVHKVETGSDPPPKPQKF